MTPERIAELRAACNTDRGWRYLEPHESVECLDAIEELQAELKSTESSMEMLQEMAAGEDW